MEEVGVVMHYFSKIGVAAIKLKKELKVGDKIKIKGLKTDFEDEVKSMQIDKNSIQKAKSGQEIGIKVKDAVKENDKVYKI